MSGGFDGNARTRGSSCWYKARASAASKSPAVGITGLVELPTNDYDALMQAVATVGPIAISVDASAWTTDDA